MADRKSRTVRIMLGLGRTYIQNIEGSRVKERPADVRRTDLMHLLYVVNRFPNDNEMNSDYFVINLPISLEQAIFPRGRARHKTKFMFHLDNYSVRASRFSINLLEEHGMHCMPHRPNHSIRLIWPG
jgi:hypothetical protein